MTNCTRSTMNWHNSSKDFLGIESNSELRARLIGSIIIGDRGSSAWAISVINSALGILQSEREYTIELAMLDSISISLEPHQIPPSAFPPPPQAFSLVTGKNFATYKKCMKKDNYADLLPLQQTKSKGDWKEGVGRGGEWWGWEWVLLVMNSNQHANIVWDRRQSVCWCAYATILYYLIYIELFL